MPRPATLRCRTIRSWMSVAHDDELSVKRRVAMDAHLAPCDACRLAQDDLASLGIALRRGAAEHRPDDSAFAGLATEVLARTPVKQDASWRQRVRDVVEGGPGLWIMGGALASTMAVPLLVATMLNATPVQPGSLAGLLQTSVSLGSNGNPVWLAKGMTLPRVWPDTRAAAMLIQPFPPLLLEQLTLAAVVTREGQLASVRILGDGPPPDAALDRAVSRLASDVRFLPAFAAGTRVAVNVVWLLERTTVRAKS